MGDVWSAPPDRLVLERSDVHIWRATLDAAPSKRGALVGTLSTNEIKRMERFFFQKNRECFIGAHGFLRAILGRYLCVRPDQVQFSYGAKGKPALATAFAQTGIKFNLSHSYAYALYAITCGREVGIDVERIRTHCSYEPIAKRYFSIGEIAALNALPPSLRHKRFFTYWTGKEAYIKALGMGLSMLTDTPDMSLVSKHHVVASPKGLEDAARAASHWKLTTLDVAPGYVGALAVEERPPVSRYLFFDLSTT